jgi:hypothetical protein
MIDQLINLAKGQVGSALAGNPGVSQVEGKNQSEAIGMSVLDAVKKQAGAGNTGILKEMLSGKPTSADAPAVQSLLPDVVTNLTSRLGISPQVAQSIAMAAIPMVMNMMNKDVSQAQQGKSGGVLGSILGSGGLGSILGGNSDKGGGLGGMLGGFLK